MLLNYHIVLTFISFVANLILGSVVLIINPQNRLNRIYSVFAFCVAYWALMKLGQAYGGTEPAAALFYKLSGPGWCFLPALYIHFVTAFTGERLPGGNRRAVPVMYCICTLLAAMLWAGGSMLSGMTKADWGYTHVPGPFYRFFFQPFFLLVFIYTTFMLVRFARGTRLKAERARALLLAAGIMIPLVGGAATNMILPSLGIHVVELALPLTTANAAIIAYSMLKYKFLTITVEFAASTIINTMADSLVVLDIDGEIVLVNPATSRLLNYEPREIIGMHFNEITERPLLVDAAKEEIAAKGIMKKEAAYIRKNGEKIPVSLSVSGLVNEERKQIVGFVCVATDVREFERLIRQLEEAKKKLEKLAVTDPLTGLNNRRHLLDRAREELLRSRRYRKPFSVALLDLDGFKAVNDGYGHKMGDEVLRIAAAKIKTNVRQTDTVARYGGDEFVVLLPETDEEEASRMAERIRMNLRSARLPEPDMHLSASIGLASSRPQGPEFTEDELLGRADEALYEAKKLGRDTIVFAGKKDENDTEPPAADREPSE